MSEKLLMVVCSMFALGRSYSLSADTLSGLGAKEMEVLCPKAV